MVGVGTDVGVSVGGEVAVDGIVAVTKGSIGVVWEVGGVVDCIGTQATNKKKNRGRSCLYSL